MSEQNVLCMFDFFDANGQHEIAINRVDVYFQNGEDDLFLAHSYEANGGKIKILARAEDGRDYLINDVLRGHLGQSKFELPVGDTVSTPQSTDPEHL